MLSIENLCFHYANHNAATLNIPEFKLKAGQDIFLHGPSGSGKSTLLALIAGINTAQQGEIEIMGTRLSSLSGNKRDQFRADHLGFIFQSFNLVPYLNALENVMLGCQFSVKRQRKARQRHGSVIQAANYLLAQLGIDELTHSQAVNSLSIGQQQRVAVARALIGEPELIIADEPTSALDQQAKVSFIKLLFQQTALCQTSLLFVSHDISLAAHFSQHIALNDLHKVAQI